MSKLKRSNSAHSASMNRLNSSIAKKGVGKNSIRARKVDYHYAVRNLQKMKNRVLSRNEKKQIFKEIV